MTNMEKKLAYARHFGKRPMALQLMTEEPPAATPPAGDTPPAATGDDKTPPAGDTKPEGDKKPFATFPDEKSFMSRIERESKKQQEAFLKSLGVEDETTLKSLLAAEKKRKDDEMTESQKLQQKIDTLETDKSAALTRAETIARKSEAKSIAAGLGISEARVERFIQMADISDIKVSDDGTVDVAEMKTRFTALLKEIPEFKGKPAAAQGGSDFGGPNSGKPALTKEAIKGMTANEIAARIDEVRKVMAQK